MRDLNNMWFQPLDRTGRFPLTQRNPMKIIDETKEKEGESCIYDTPSFYFATRHHI